MRRTCKCSHSTSHVVLITSNFFFFFPPLPLFAHPNSSSPHPFSTAYRAPLAMAKATKATIKFQKKHLKGAIEQRRKKQKATQLYKKRNPKKFGRDATKPGSASTGGDAEESDEEGKGGDGDNDNDEKGAGKE